MTIAAALVVAATLAMQLGTGDFVAKGAIPAALMSTDCGGENRAPSLIWRDVPAGTKSFALVVHDPDAPIAGGFYHWVVYNLPASMHQLRGNQHLDADQVGIASTGKAAYYGPCPPPGPAHHYVFTLYALDVEHISGDTPLTALQLEQRIAGHVLGKATLEATASHS